MADAGDATLAAACQASDLVVISVLLARVVSQLKSLGSTGFRVAMMGRSMNGFGTATVVCVRLTTSSRSEAG